MFQKLYVKIFTNIPLFLKPFFGPSYYQCFGCDNILPHAYDASPIEALSGTFLDYELWALSFSKYYLPYYILTRSGNLDVNEIAKCAVTYGTIVAATWFVLGVSRSLDTDYNNFIKIFSENDKEKLKKFDFSMTHWPTDYSANTSGNKLVLEETKHKGLRNPIYSAFGATLGKCMIMPGCLGFIKNQMQPHFLRFRSQFITKHGARRMKIDVNTESFVDSMFFDNRAKGGNGRTLIICSEGNAAFYEVGIVTIPLAEGFSVIGWNRPGFGESRGVTNPQNERDAIKAILEYSKFELKFDKIILFGWSIGGYPTAVGANVKDNENNPIVTGLILDATFDHIAPLAGVVLPAWFEPIATSVVKQEWDLDVSREVCKFKGPVVFFRRLRDEILSTGGPTRPDLNRINWLLYDVIQSRFPVISDRSLSKVKNYIERGGSLAADDEYERMIFKFVKTRFVDIASGHNEPLPQKEFRMIFSEGKM